MHGDTYLYPKTMKAEAEESQVQGHPGIQRKNQISKKKMV